MSFNLAPGSLALTHTDPQKQKALEAYLKHGTVRAACYMAGIGRTTWYQWIADDAEFARLAREAGEHVTDQLEQVAQQRATSPKDGSDTLLIFLLKSRDRARFGDRQLITEISAEVRMRIEATTRIIASKPSWDSEELLRALDEIWK